MRHHLHRATSLNSYTKYEQLLTTHTDEDHEHFVSLHSLFQVSYQRFSLRAWCVRLYVLEV